MWFKGKLTKNFTTMNWADGWREFYFTLPQQDLIENRDLAISNQERKLLVITEDTLSHLFFSEVFLLKRPVYKLNPFKGLRTSAPN